MTRVKQQIISSAVIINGTLLESFIVLHISKRHIPITKHRGCLDIHSNPRGVETAGRDLKSQLSSWLGWIQREENTAHYFWECSWQAGGCNDVG